MTLKALNLEVFYGPLQALFGVSLPEGDYETLAGLFLSRMPWQRLAPETTSGSGRPGDISAAAAGTRVPAVSASTFVTRFPPIGETST